MGIRTYFINKKIKSALEHLKKIMQTTELSKINKVAIIVGESSLFNDTHYKSLQKQMGLDDTQFNILTIKQKKSDYNEFKGVVLLTNQINLKGDIISPDIHHFTDSDYDLLIDFIPTDSPLKQLINAKVNARIKVGYAGNNSMFYNFILKVDAKEIDLFISELVKYLHILKII